MQANKTQYYWAQYTRNNKSIWIGENTESLIQKNIILNQLNILQKEWTIISNISELVELKKNSSINKNYYFFPNAKDIIPFVLLRIQEKIFPDHTDNNINYLYHFF